MQPPQIPIISAEDAGELVVQGILEDRLLVLTDPLAESMIHQHAADREAFLASQIQWLDASQ